MKCQQYILTKLQRRKNVNLVNIDLSGLEKVYFVVDIVAEKLIPELKRL